MPLRSAAVRFRPFAATFPEIDEADFDDQERDEEVRIGATGLIESPQTELGCFSHGGRSPQPNSQLTEDPLTMPDERWN